MPIVRIEHVVADYTKWKEAFDRDPADRKASGVRRYQICRAADNPNCVMIDVELGSLAEAEAFVRRMQGIWSGPAKGMLRSPSARIVELVEAKEV